MTDDKRINRNNTSGYPGVAWDRQHKRWRATVYHDCEQIVCGYYDTVEEAVKARKAKMEAQK